MNDPGLFSSLVRGRQAAEDHMKFMWNSGDFWHERTVTHTLFQHAAPYVRPVEFTQNQEGELGADWLWWWIDPSGDCFGMLVQAKSLKHERGKWYVDFNYRRGHQITRLMQTAAHFEVPAAYVLYCGDSSYRANLTCGSKAHDATCDHCSRAGVSIIDAFGAKKLSALPESVGVNAFQFSSPLEDIADPTYNADWLSHPIGPVLRDFVTGSQSGARKVALRIFQLAMRTMIFAYAGPVWQKVDALSPYFLRGWREEVPSYVRDVMSGDSIPPEISDNIAGIVVLQL